MNTISSLKLWPAILRVAFVGALTLTQSGCKHIPNRGGIPATEMRPDERGFVGGTGIEPQDLVRVTDKMARSILATPQIANALNPPHLLLFPVENNTRFPIQQELFLDRMRAELNSKTRNKVSFLMRDAITRADASKLMSAVAEERDRKRTGQVTSSSNRYVQEFKGADFILTGKLGGMTTSSAVAGRSDYVLYTFQLVDTRTDEIVWEDFDEIKKQGSDAVIYR